MNAPTQLPLSSPDDEQKRTYVRRPKDEYAAIAAFLREWVASGIRLFSDEDMVDVLNYSGQFDFDDEKPLTKSHIAKARVMADLEVPKGRYTFDEFVVLAKATGRWPDGQKEESGALQQQLAAATEENAALQRQIGNLRAALGRQRASIEEFRSTTAHMAQHLAEQEAFLFKERSTIDKTLYGG